MAPIQFDSCVLFEDIINPLFTKASFEIRQENMEIKNGNWVLSELSSFKSYHQISQGTSRMKVPLSVPTERPAFTRATHGLRKLWIVTAIFSILILYGCGEYTGPPVGVITGVILDTSNQPVQNTTVALVKVRVIEQEDDSYELLTADETTRIDTDAGGRYEFRGLEAGTYVVSMMLPDSPVEAPISDYMELKAGDKSPWIVNMECSAGRCKLLRSQ